MLTEIHAAADDRELMLTRAIDAVPHQVWRCWTGPELLKHWFTPRPWTTPEVRTDVRPSYTARVRHGSAADREAHEKMGFHPGWGRATDPLAALAASL